MKKQQSDKNKIEKTKSGFTLIELMVATSIFVVVMLVSISSMMSLIAASKNSRILRSAIDSVDFSMESIARSIRMGKNYYCGGSVSINIDATNDCYGGDDSISFIPQNDNSRVAYRLGTETNGGITHNTVEKCNPDCVSIVSKDVDIEKLKFFVKGSAFDNTQASVYIIMKGTVTTQKGPTSFSLQTLASQRNF